MSIEYFIEYLKLNKLARADFANFDLPEEFLMEYDKRFEIINRHQQSHYSDILLDLVANYTMGNLYIGMISFLNEVYEVTDYYIVGSVDFYRLAVVKKDNQIVVLEEEDNIVAYHASKNGKSFLEALLLVFGYLNSQFKSGHDDSPEEKKVQIDACCMAAGGDQYRDLYGLLLL